MRENGQDIIELYFRPSMAANSIVGGQVWLKIKLIEALIVVLTPARMMKIHPKMKALVCLQHYFYHKSIEIFSDVQGQLTP